MCNSTIARFSMKRNSNTGYFLVILAVVLVAWTSASTSGGLTPAQERGKQIYTLGTSAKGTDIVAVMSGANVPASVMPCINCHGESGGGNPEGGVQPSNLTWPSLTRSYAQTTVNGRTHPAYTVSSLTKAISMGLDPAGNELQSAMPRYQMNRDDMLDLIEYLKVIGEQTDPGVLEDELRIGILLPPNRKKANAMHAVLEAYISQVNSAGGFYGRTISLHAHVPDAAHPADSLRAFLSAKNIFAFCSSELPGADPDFAELINRLEVPVVGVLSGDPAASVLQSREIFYLLPGPAGQGAALMDLARDSLDLLPGEFAVLHAGGAYRKRLSSTLSQHVHLSDRKNATVVEWEGGMAQNVAELKESGIKAVVWLGQSGSQTQQLLHLLAEHEWHPHILIPAEFAGPEFLTVSAAFEGKVLIAYPTWFTVLESGMGGAFTEFSAKHKLPKNHKQAQLSVLAGGILLSEALRGIGRELSREKLRTELENVFALQTGLLPPLTYGVNRRTGSFMVFIATPEIGKNKLRLVQVRRP